MTLYYDGKHVTLFGKRTQYYATMDAPDNIDAAIDFARDQLGLDAPAADLLYADAYKGLMENVQTGRYIGNEPVGDRMCHHLAYHGATTDWQIWIEDGPRPLPCRYVITSTDVKGQPELVVAFARWDTAPHLAANTFDFTPPSGATQIPFLNRQKVEEMKE